MSRQRTDNASASAPFLKLDPHLMEMVVRRMSGPEPDMVEDLSNLRSMSLVCVQCRDSLSRARAEKRRLLSEKLFTAHRRYRELAYSPFRTGIHPGGPSVLRMLRFTGAIDRATGRNLVRALRVVSAEEEKEGLDFWIVETLPFDHSVNARRRFVHRGAKNGAITVFELQHNTPRETNEINESRARLGWARATIPLSSATVFRNGGRGHGTDAPIPLAVVFAYRWIGDPAAFEAKLPELRTSLHWMEAYVYTSYFERVTDTEYMFLSLDPL